MNLSTLQEYFQACLIAQTQLQQHWSKLAKAPSYSLFKCIANKSQPKIDASLIRSFLYTFNWQLHFVEEQTYQQQSNYKIHSSASRFNPQQLLDYGIQLLLQQWGTNQTLTFEEFSIFIKGDVENPIDKQVQFIYKKEMFQCFINQMLNLIKLQKLRKLVFYAYKNLSDLFESITASNQIQVQNINRLFLSFSQKKQQRELKRISKRCKLPWDFNAFIKIFNINMNSKTNQFKIHQSARKVKDNGSTSKDFFTTPRKEKYEINQTSTKLTKKYEASAAFTTPSKTISKAKSNLVQQAYPQTYIQILANLLQLEQKFNDNCSQLIKRKDFDLQLVYERHGRKFQQILNQRYGVCNFSAFVRFIVPRDYQHRYLSFIRYQADDKLTPETQKQIDLMIQRYHDKEQQINNQWAKCNKEMFLQYFSLPKQQIIRSQKFLQFFTTREAQILLQRLDPHKKGQITLEQLH